MHAKVEFGMYFGYETLKVKLSLISSTQAFLETKLLIMKRIMIKRSKMITLWFILT